MRSFALHDEDFFGVLDVYEWKSSFLYRVNTSTLVCVGCHSCSGCFLLILQNALATCGVVVDQQSASVVLPPTVQQNCHAGPITANLSVQSFKSDADAVSRQYIADGKWTLF